MSIPAATRKSSDVNPLDELPELPLLPSLKPEEKSALDEWWRQVRVVLDRWRDEEIKP